MSVSKPPLAVIRPVIVAVPPVNAPVVAIAPAPTSIEVNPDVIEPTFNAPTETRLAVVVIAD